MTCGDLSCDNFRPDITIFINGLPLAFIEVKKENNHEGVDAERKRMKTRFTNPCFRRFLNITQIMVFSNDMEYDEQLKQGAYYATIGKTKNTHYQSVDVCRCNGCNCFFLWNDCLSEWKESTPESIDTDYGGSSIRFKNQTVSS
jgi:type I site-specific restriction-modification system R (restriction) subunit